ncbi:MAG: GTPase [Candidatus Odinarchaeia archaeon]
MNVKKEGAGQVVLVGLTNSGKSSILSRITSANVKIADYPFTTKKPEVGMLNYGGAMIQIVEAPAVFPQMSSSTVGRQILTLIRNADVLILVIDLSVDPKMQLETILSELNENGIKLNIAKPPIKIEKTGSGGIQIFGENLCEASRQDIVDVLKENGISNAVVTIKGNVSLEDIAEVLDESIVYKPSFIVGNKGDLHGSVLNFKNLIKKYGKRFKIIPVSCKLNKGFEDVTEEAFKSLKVIRIYTKEPEGEIAKKPMILPEGATVEMVAKRLHSRFLKKFKYAKIFGPSAKFDGEKVGLEHVLMDKDIVQIFTE